MKKFVFTGIAVVAAAVLLTAVPSCRDKDSDDSENRNINQWIWDNLDFCYLWRDQMNPKLSKSLDPVKYFENQLSSEDHFSWIQENFVDLLNMLSGVQMEAGYDFQLIQVTYTAVVGFVTYVKPNSPAEEAGLKRGDIFSCINGSYITVNNYTELVNLMSEPHKLGLIQMPDLNVAREVSLSVVQYKENPVFLDTVYTIDSKKIGYLVYNAFTRDNGDGSLAYDKQLNEVFGTFKAEQINDLIIDLRNNGGGAVVTANELAGMISGHGSSDLFALSQYNELLGEYYRKQNSNYDRMPFVDGIERYDAAGNVTESFPMNKLNLNRVHFITSKRTASASEMTINALNPFIDVVLVGDTTYGKNVGSITIYEEDKEKQKTNKWGMQPVVAKIANGNGFSAYGGGFIPTEGKGRREWDEFFNGISADIRPLGDTSEYLLRVALDKVLGRTTRTRKSLVQSLPALPHKKGIGAYIDLPQLKDILSSRKP